MKHRKGRDGKRELKTDAGVRTSNLTEIRQTSVRGQRLDWVVVALIMTLVAIAYRNTYDAGFIWDDDDHVTQNTTLRDGQGLLRIWLERGAVPQYYPLVHTAFWIEYQLWGLNAAGYHVVNVLLHGLAAVLLWRVLSRLAVPGSLLAALIFALHPVAVESVAWISERKNVLSAVLYLAAALAWLRTQSFSTHPSGVEEATARPEAAKHFAGNRWYWISVACFTGAMLSKSVACSLPAALLLLTWLKRGRIDWRLDVVPLLPYFGIGLVLAANTALMERTLVGAVGPEWDFSLLDRILIAGRAVWFYASKLVWPANLSFIYPRWEINASDPFQWMFPLAAVAVVVLAWWFRDRIGRAPLVALLFFGGTLVPALGFINVYPMRFSFVADHFQYVASIGLIAFVAAFLARAPVTSRPAYALPAFLAWLTWNQTRDYQNLETLWRNTIARNPSAWLAHNNLGNILLDRGSLDSATALYREGIRQKSDYYEAHANLGSALLQQGSVESARLHTESALRIAPGYTPALVTQAGVMLRDGQIGQAIQILQDVLRQDADNVDALNSLGSALALRSDPTNAQRAFESALGINPDHVSARVNLARLLAQLGRIDAASDQIDDVLRRSPRASDARNLKGMLLLARGESAQALLYFRNLATDTPNDAGARFNLGTLLAQANQTREAIASFDAAIRLNPSHAEARNNLGIAYLVVGQYVDAAEQFTAAIRLRRNNPEAHNNLAYALIRLSRIEEAVSHLRQALALRPEYQDARAQLRSLGRRP